MELVSLTNLLLETEKRLGLADFDFFNEHILGCRGLANVHHELCRRAQYGPKRQLTLIPRGHLKSTILTIGYSIWRIVCDNNIRICIANAKQDNAETFLTEIKGHFESNQKLRTLYGDFVGKKWNEGELVVSQRTKTRKEPTIKATGVGASLVSQHYDVVIGDDLINETNITTKDQIEKVKDWWRLAQSLGDGDQTDWRLIGTRYHYDDLYGDIIENKSETYSIYIRRAIEEGIPIFPSKFNLLHLEEIRREQGSYIYSCQYNNEPIDDEDAVFKREWIKTFTDDDWEEVKRIKGFYFVTIDPAVSEDSKSDNTVFIVNYVTINNDWYIVKIDADHYSPRQIIDKIFEYDELYQPKTTGIETHAMQKILRYMLDEEMSSRNTFIPITELKPDNVSKKLRIRGLQPRFENGKIYIKENTKETDRFIDEYLRFPRAAHDDRLDALAYQLDVAFPPRVHEERRKKKKYLNNLTRY